MGPSPFDPAAFAGAGHTLVDLLAHHLQSVTGPTNASVPVLPWVAPDEMVKRWPADFAVPRDLRALVEAVVSGSNHLHHPRYVGHQVTSPLPAAALLEMVSALLNNGSAVYEMGPVSIGMERSALRWMASRLGFPGAMEGDTDGVLTSGGSAGNLTALLAMRQAMAGFDVWTEGNHGGPPLAVLASDQTHYCVKRSLQVMGWGNDAVIPVPTDDRYRMRADALDDALARGRAGGRKVVAVVASGGSTATGAIDPLGDVADFAHRHGLWMHVDGAHGASFVVSKKLRPRLDGIERADSVVWDAHKMMLVPALVTAVVFREGKRSYESFSQDASYLFSEKDPAEEWFNVGQRTLECTKRMMGFLLYGTLAVHGEAYFAEYVEKMVDLSARFAARITEEKGFELPVVPDGNIVCFRYRPQRFSGDGAALDALQARIRMDILESGAFYLVQTRLRDGVYLRTTLINPRTSDAHLEELLVDVRRRGDRLMTTG